MRPLRLLLSQNKIAMSLTSIVSKVFLARQKELEKYQNEGEAMQMQALTGLVQRAKDTQYGRDHLFTTVKSYDDFRQTVPLNTYEELKQYIDQMRHGDRDVLWPGQVKWYAKSSGTTNDK